MQDETQRRRAGKRLLVAAIGVATVSYVSTQSGCAADGDLADDLDAESATPYDDEDSAAEIEGTSQALQTSTAVKSGIDVAKLNRPQEIIRVRWPVGNLLPPPVGNLMGPPIEVLKAADLEKVK